MLNLKRLAFFLCLFACYQTAFSQLGFSHEIGVIAGPVEFRSDFGNRDNTETNFGNSGIGIGIVHYINFAYRADCNCYTTDTYFNDHFKLRNEISWNKTNLEHFGKWVDPSRNTVEANQLRGHKGVAKNLDIGTQLEYFPLSIRSFQSFGYRVAPFVSLGVHYTSFNPEVSTTYVDMTPNSDVIFGDVTDFRNFYSGWDSGSVDASGGSTWSVVSSVGARYKVSKLADIMLDFRLQYYFNDWVDGLNHQLDYNKNNDWLVWVNVGYIYYLN
ncbi:glutamate dehydrogenase [Mariniflexile jejuense]|uniref:Glutamate dehydrogenase n=1 Tax=Mariniflexile jejuense TaxID=1173582 RepID=A0ABW3JKP7_9FLAO